MQIPQIGGGRMFKVFLVLSVFVGDTWQFLSDEAKPFNDIEEGTQLLRSSTT
jgi:hypothetical protein